MKRAHRHTIMSGRVVTFAENFDSTSGSSANAYGPFEVSASRNMVMVHSATINTVQEKTGFLRAIELAWEECCFLARCNGRPDDNDTGEPRKV